MATRLSKTAAQALATRLNASVRLRSQYSALLSNLDGALVKLDFAQDNVQAKRQALALFLGLSPKATLGEIEAAAQTIKKMKKV